MHRFLLIALGTSLLIPTVAKAESWYLLAAGKGGNSNKEALTSWTVPMTTEELCEAAGQKLVNDKGWLENGSSSSFVFKAGNTDRDPSIHYTCVRAK